jgi:putative transposase
VIGILSEGLDDKMISLYARAMSAREIVDYLHVLRIEVSPELIGAITETVLEEVSSGRSPVRS